MFQWIRRQLIFEAGRTAFVSFAIGGALAVVLILEGFQSGLYIQLKNVVLNRGADLIVVQSGVTNFVASRSLLPQLSRMRVESVEGVAAAYPMTMVPVIYSQTGYRKSPIFFVVTDTAGGPRHIQSGRPATEAREIVIDESLAVLYDLKPGDPFVVADFEFKIAGIAHQAAALFTAFVFINYDDMIDFFFESDLVGDISTLPLVSFLLVELFPGADMQSVAAAIEAAEEDGDVFTPAHLSQNDAALGRTLFGPVMGVMIAVAYVVVLLIVGMIMFAGVHARRRSFGMLKALGFSNAALAKGMVLEALCLTALAFPLGLLLAELGARFIEVRAPLYLIPVAEAATLLRSLAAALALAMIGAVLPLPSVARLDPAIAFRR